MEMKMKALWNKLLNCWHSRIRPIFCCVLALVSMIAYWFIICDDVQKVTIAIIVYCIAGILLSLTLSNVWNKVFCFTCLVCLAYFAVPKLLEAPDIYNFVGKFLSGLRYSEYKSTYAESIGGLLGSVVGITGAMWTQHIFEQQKEKKEDIANTRIVFYDFDFAFREVRERVDACEKNANGNLNQVKLAEKFSNYTIFIDNKWIRTVASLPDDFNSHDIKHLYYIYGEINAINNIIHSQSQSRNKDLHDKIVSFYNLIPDSFVSKRTSITNSNMSIKEKTQCVYNTLACLAKIPVEEKNAPANSNGNNPQT